MFDDEFDISIILPIYNAEAWLKPCLQSIVDQTYNGPLELSVYNDASNDQSMDIVHSYIKKLSKRNVKVIISQSENCLALQPKGCGYAKNQAVLKSSGKYLCFLDADDIMDCERIKVQYETASNLPSNTLIGCQVVRDPPESTARYTKWINCLTSLQLYTQIYTSNGPTVVMPTWFCHRSVFDAVGGFDEGGKGVPEDYLFFLKFLNDGGKLHRVDTPLLVYRHHSNATSLSVSEKTLWDIRIKEIEEKVLSKWKGFTIWNAGKQGRRFYRDISKTNKEKVSCFCDVDLKKISKGYYVYELDTAKVKTKVPIVHFENAVKPFIICMKLDLTGGAFEKNLSSLNLQEGVDYVFFC